MSPPAQIALENLNRQNLAMTLEDLRSKGGDATPSNPVHLALNFRVDPDPIASAVVSSALVGSLGTIPISVSSAASAVGAVIRSGLATALHARRAPTLFESGNGDLGSPGLGSTWTPASKRALNALFAELPPQAPGLFGPKHALFINPHRTTGRFGPDRLTALVRRWLFQRFGADLSVLDEVAFALDQLITNVDQHAVVDEQPSVMSQVNISVDPDERRLVALIVDSGPGVPTTLRRKDDGSFPDSDEDLVRDLLLGELSNWGRARGVGLSRLSERIGAFGGELTLLSGGTSAHVRVEDVETETLPLQPGGTVFEISLPLR